MTASATLANDILNYACRGTAPTALTTSMKMSLHSTDPGATGAAEVVNSGGSSYARQTANYATASGGTCALSGTVSFTNLPAGTYGYMGIWDNSGTPKFMFGTALSAPQTVPGLATINITAATTSLVHN